MERVHDAMLRVFTRIAHFEHAGQVWVYVRRTVFLELTSLPRTVSLEVLEDGGFEPEDRHEPPSDPGDPGDISAAVSELREHLTLQDREILDSLIHGEPSVAEISARLGLSPRTVKRRRHALTLMLRAYLRRKMGEAGGGVGPTLPGGSAPDSGGISGIVGPDAPKTASCY